MADRPAFELYGVVHLIRPWGSPAPGLQALRDGIAVAPDEVIFRHAVQYPLRHPAAEHMPPDDFSAWIGGVAQDSETAERLSFVVQGAHGSPGALREALLAVLDAIPAGRRATREAHVNGAFRFLSADSLSFPTGVVVRDGHEVVDALLEAEASVWFLHLIEQPWHGGGRAPLLDWLAATGLPRLAAWLTEAATSGLPIDKARARVRSRWSRSRIGRQVAEATRSPEDVRRATAHDVVARLVRRRLGGRDLP